MARKPKTGAMALRFQRSGWRRRGLQFALAIAGLALAALLYSTFSSISSIADPTTIQGRVTRIVDGSGLVIAGVEIRLGDFDAPEWGEPGGRETAEALRSIALGKRVICTRCEGAPVPGQCASDDHVIATCRLDGERLGDLMRARGIKEGGR